MAAVWEGKKYKKDSSENYILYLDALGTDINYRQIASVVSPIEELIKNADDTYTLKTTNAVRDFEITFKLGEEVNYETFDRRQVKGIFTFDGNVLTQVEDGGKPTTIVRTYTEKDMLKKMTVDDIECTRHFRLVREDDERLASHTTA